MALQILSRVVALLFVVAVSAAPLRATEIDLPGYVLSLNNPEPNTSTPLSFIFSPKGSCLGVGMNGLNIDERSKEVKLSISVSFSGFLCPFSPRQSVPIGKLAGSDFDGEDTPYSFTVYEEDPLGSGALFDEAAVVGQFELDVPRVAPWARRFHETPSESSRQSGLSMIRGWACEADLIEIQFDDMERIKLAYGGRRTDTVEVCGDDDNGYGMVMAWGLLGQGTHTMKLYWNGYRVEEHEFEVVGFDDPFVTGIEGSFELMDFPGPGEATTIEWNEPGQNFKIIDLK